MNDTKLLPCPFCGEDAYLVTWHQGTQIAARCEGCTCDGPMRGIESQAIAAWNTRAITPELVDLVTRFIGEEQIRNLSRANVVQP